MKIQAVNATILKSAANQGSNQSGEDEMAQVYSDPKRESDPHALPDVEVFQLTATEVASMDEDLIGEYIKSHPLASFNSRDREAMLGAIVEEEGINSGWYWHTCFPGCLPESDPYGPFETAAEAKADAQNREG